MPVLNNIYPDDPLLFDICDSFAKGQASFTRANRIDYDQAAELVNMDIRRDGVLTTRRGTQALPPFPSLHGFDFAVIRYQWLPADGTDLDTRTAILGVDASINGIDVGWDRNTTVSGASGAYLTWAGDNTTTSGQETVLFNVQNLKTDFPSAASGQLRLRAFWYAARGDGNLTVQIVTYKGGTMSEDTGAHDFTNSGGTQIDLLTIAGNAATQESGNNDGDPISTLSFNFAGTGADLTSDTALPRAQGIAWYNTPQHQYLFAISRGSAYVTDGPAEPAAYFLWDGSSWTGIAQSSTLFPADELRDVNAIQGVDKLYIADGRNPLLVFDGTNITSAGTGGNSQPPTGAILCWHTNRLFIAGTAAVPDQLAASNYLDGATFDLQNYSIRVGADEADPITGLASWQEYDLVVLKRNSLWVVHTDPGIDTAQPYAGTWTVQRVHASIGCVSTRSVCQVGQDVWFLSDTGVRSVRRVIATDQNEISDTISYPIQDLIDRINWSSANKAAAVFWNNRYILSVPLDTAEDPDTVLVYNTLTQAWSGYWTGWTPLQFAVTSFEGNLRLNFCDPLGYLYQWLDYISPLSETPQCFQDENGDTTLDDIASSVTTRAMTFKEVLSPKKGNHLEAEFFESSASADINVILDEGTPAPLAGQIATTDAFLTLPLFLPFTLPSAGVYRRAFDLMQFDPWRELQVQVSADSGKLSLRGIFASAFFDTINLEE